MATPRQQVLLLKTKSIPTDPYDTFFRSKDVEPVFVPVMAHRHVNLDSVTRILSEGRTQGLGAAAGSVQPEYGAIILTSQRAVEALGSALNTLKDTLSPQSSTTPIYVVGPATAKSVRNLGFPSANIHGQECGTGELLAHYILKHYSSPIRNLLFLVGEVRRDIIPKTLGAAGFGVDEVVIYETTVMTSFREDFVWVLDEVKEGHPTPWVVIFSPTGSDTAIEVLGRGSSGSGQRKVHLVTIGPTTASHLRDTLHVEPDGVAEKPSAEGLWAVLEGYRQASI
ncbi:tetrapyrrole biosynthesis, uroporphyrinogen III synthase [Peziza echinospora]|nr:tetrapyrrole biosynthesis, uroporphyrinogen III synthase [Peziza echinospora]